MAFFVVTMAHPSGRQWDDHLDAHVKFLKRLVASGKLIASGPLKDTGLRSGFLIFKAGNRAEVQDLVAEDPFAVEGLIVGLTINEWDPLFGAFATESSGKLAGRDLAG